MDEKLAKLQKLLKELFQLDEPDLDFGLYRVMHAKAGEVQTFLERGLPEAVNKAFGKYQSADKAGMQQELAKVVAQLQALDAPVETNAKVKELKEKLATTAVDVDSLRGDVFSHLFTFFRRYYSEGDFVSKQVYKDGVYAIPYRGEEVKLHWANADQYYIKTSQYLRHFAFKVGDGEPPRRVVFKLVDAAEGAHGNVKEAAGQARVFVLCRGDFAKLELGPDGHDLVLRFEYRPATTADVPADAAGEAKKPPKQDALLADAAARILALSEPELQPWLVALRRPAATDKQRERKELHRRLEHWTKSNTFDYFIHKDLGGFLRRELDFYIKNEVMHLDDIERETEARFGQYLSKIRVLREVAGAVIQFLAQLEEFQKRLWLKKKFVVETSWCVRVGLVPEDLLAEVAGNDGQRAEWVKYCGISQLPHDLASTAFPKYSVPLGVPFLKANPSLVLDTRHFDAAFSARLLAAIGDVDGQTDGVVVHSENFQALALVQTRYRENVKCVYIDPPYNAKTSEILYKNTFKHSSWLAMMGDRVGLALPLQNRDSVFVCAIDENEQERIGMLLEQAMPEGHAKACVSVVHNPRGIQGGGFSYTHEFAYFMHRQGLRLGLRALGEAKSKPLMKTGSESERQTGRNCFYPIYVRDGAVLGFGDVPSDQWHPESGAVKQVDGSLAVWPISTDGRERKWRYARQTIEDVAGQLEVRLGHSGLPVPYLAKDFESYRTVWSDAEFNAAEYGSTLLKNIVGSDAEFSFPKSIWTVLHALNASSVGPGDLVLDFFGGSGTTGHAVINLNREDGGRRKFILVEMADYFDTVLLPRLKKVTFTPDWKDGKPKRLASQEETDRAPRILKILRLESYEDTLNNLALRPRTTEQDALFAGNPAFHQQYLLKYLLPAETAGSPSLLDLGAFADPTAYKLVIKRPGGDESRQTSVDLVETFNWLLGLQVSHYAAPATFAATFAETEHGRMEVADRLRPDPAGQYWFRSVTGKAPNGDRVLVIWRKLTGQLVRDNAVLDTWFSTLGYSTKDAEFDSIYVNGDNNLENLKRTDETWKVRRTEDEFYRLMFADADAAQVDVKAGV